VIASIDQVDLERLYIVKILPAGNTTRKADEVCSLIQPTARD
jgi:hypothetical protein